MYAQNLLGGEKRKRTIIELGGQKGSYYNYTKINYIVLIVLYDSFIMLYYIIIYYIMIY